MVKVLFAYQKHPVEPLGIGYLASSIARGGHETKLVLTSEKIDRAVELVEETIRKEKPDIFAQSIIFGSHGYAIELNKQIKRNHPDIVSFLGGPAATFTPELIDRGFDAISRYEGEDPFLEFCNALEEEKDVGNIPNIWVKENPDLYRTDWKLSKISLKPDDPRYGHVNGYDRERRRFVNDTRRLQEGNDLDRIPPPDRAVTYDNLIVGTEDDPKIFADNTLKHFMHTRGCPWHCAYCHVEMMNIENKGKGKTVRRRKNEAVAEEVLDVMKTYGGELVYYQDDIMGFAHRLEDAIAYADVFQPLGYPAHGHVRFDTISKNENIAKELRRGGITGVHVAIEAGDEDMRNRVHRRDMTDEQIFRGAAYLDKYGIKKMTQNILGGPGETREQMIKTFEMNKLVRPTFASASIFQPYPGTSELEYARDKGHLPKMDQNRLIDTFGFDTFYSGSILTLDPKHKRWLEVFHKFFAIGVDEQLDISDLEKRMEPYLKDDSRDHELAEIYQEHRKRKDEELYGFKFKETVAPSRMPSPAMKVGLAGRNINEY
jgi:anaerobic magnesium-protoporphyrin IX monomethyl ester cyclase